MASSNGNTTTETIVLEVKGKTDGAVAASNKVVEAQKRMQRQAEAAAASMSNLSKVMVGLPPPPAAAATALGKLRDGIRDAGFDAKELGAGLKEMGKGIAFDFIKQGVAAIAGAFDQATGAAVQLGIQGAALGMQLAGPLGAVAGAAGGVIASLLMDDSEHERFLAQQKDIADAYRIEADLAKQFREEIASINDSYEEAERRGLEAQTARVTALKDSLALSGAAIDQRAEELRLAEALLRVERGIVALRSGFAGGDDAVIAIGRQRRDAEIDAKYDTRTYGPLLSGIEKDLAHKGDQLNDIKRALALPGLTPDVRRALLAKRNNLLGVRALKGGAQTGSRLGGLIGGVSFDYDLGAGVGGAGGFGQAAIGSTVNVSAEDNARIRANEEMANRIADLTNASYGRQADGRFANLAGENKPALERMFGTIDEINGYKVAFDGLTGAVTAGMEAWISGTESAGGAIKKFIGKYLGAVATQMGIEALKHAAYAIASLIPGPTFNPGAAAGHAIAAAKFGLGAVAAAVAARELGAGGGSTTQASGGSNGARASGGGGSSSAAATAPPSPPGGQTNVNIIMGDAGDDSTPRMRRLKAERIWERARGTTGTVQE